MPGWLATGEPMICLVRYRRGLCLIRGLLLVLGVSEVQGAPF
jgi:hypothetical protein